jgi:hypothetical protein
LAVGTTETEREKYKEKVAEIGKKLIFWLTLDLIFFSSRA